jgi:hypothetical protein
MMPSKDEVAEKLARAHYLIEPEISQIFRLSDSAEIETRPNEPIKLLEVNPDTLPSGILPLHFGPHPASGISYPSVIVEITPEEYEQVQKGNLQLPNGWQIGKLFQRPNGLEKPHEH